MTERRTMVRKTDSHPQTPNYGRESVDNSEIQEICEVEHEEELDDSGEFESLMGSDEQLHESYSKYNPKTNNKNPDLKLGLVFSSKDEAKIAIESHCLRRGMQNDHSWKVKSYNPVHNKYSWAYNNKNLNPIWIGKTFMKKFKDNPKLGVNEFKSELCTILKTNVSK
ncbi:hypothetical protein Salat_2776600 [Sesamum alatum]|uniref:Uncharacterized protein n=1 Tax=Sesamum alatum TaxID=300844 RepID=A0AAE1XLK7_9LAMI|nr:hypothetical protein Salat_2776600 [Sesamum alatum]